MNKKRAEKMRTEVVQIDDSVRCFHFKKGKQIFGKVKRLPCGRIFIRNIDARTRSGKCSEEINSFARYIFRLPNSLRLQLCRFYMYRLFEGESELPGGIASSFFLCFR